MRIDKVINNNVVSVKNEQNKELVIMGRGLGFKKKPGDNIDKELIEKIFTLDNQELTDRFKKLLNEIPMNVMNVTEEIVNLAKVGHNRTLSDSIYVSLADHIHFALERHQKGMDIRNGLLWEIKKLYRDEYQIGLKALEIIKNDLGVNLPEDEAGFVAMHIVNSQLNEEMPNILKITNLIQEILNIVKYHFNKEFDEESLNYFRFVTHLKFFGQRLFGNAIFNEEDNSLYELIKEKHAASYQCVKKIEGFILAKYQYKLSNEEKLYLIIHINRVTNR